MPRVFRILRSRHVIEPEITAEELSSKPVCSQNKRKHEKVDKDQKEAETPKHSEKESTGQRKDENKGKQSTAQPVDHTKPTEPPADQEFWEKRGSHFVCKKCDKEFKMLYILRRHLPIHTGERRFKCNQCGCTFKQSSTLSRHLDLHKNTRRFSCDTCGAAFNRASTLMQHKKTHSKEKQFACPHCDKKFHQKGNLKSHIFTHTGEKPHECPVCHQRFNQQSNLALHMSSRHTDKPTHNCSLCGQMFIRKKFLRNHEVQDHGLKLPVYVTRQLDTPSPTKQTNVVKTVPKCVRQQVGHSTKTYGTNTVSLKNGDKTIRFPGYEFKNGSQEQVKMRKNDTEMQSMAAKHTGTGEIATKTTDVTQTTKSTVPVTSAVLSGVTLLSELAAAQTNKNTSQSSTDDVPQSGLIVSQSGTNKPQTGTSVSQSCAEVALSGAHVTQSVMNVLQDSSNSTKESTGMPVITVLGRDSNNKLVVEVKMPNQQPRIAHLVSAIPETQPRTLQISSMHGKQTMNPPKSVLTGGTINTTGCTINTTGGTINTTGCTINTTGGTVNPIGGSINTTGGTINTTGGTINTSGNKTSLPSGGGIAKTTESHSLTVMPSEPSTTCTTTKSCSQLAPHHTDSENTSKNDTGSRDSNHKGTPILDSFLNIVRRPNVAKESQSGITEKSPSGTNTQLSETEKYNELLKTDLFPTALFSNIKPVTNNNITLTSTPCICGATQQENPVINLVSGVCTSVPVHPMANLNTQNNSHGQGVPQGQMAFRNEEVLQNQIVLPSAVLMPGNGATNTAVPSLQPVPVGTTIAESSTTVAKSFGFNNRGSKRTTIHGDRVPSILPKRNKSQIERSSFLPSSVASQVRSSMTHHRLKSGGEVSINHEASGPCTLDEGRGKDDDKSNSRVELDSKSSEKSSQSLDDVLSQYAKFALTPSPIAPKPAQQRKNPELAQLELSQPKITVGSNAVLTTPVVQLGTAVSHTLSSSGILGPLQTQQPSVLQPTALPYILIPANINPTPTAIVNSTQTAFVTPQQTGFVNPAPTPTIYPTTAATVNPTPTATVNPPPTVILNPSATSTVNPTQIVLSLVPNVKETAPMQCSHNKDLGSSLNKIQPTQKSVQLNANPNELHEFTDVGDNLKFNQHKLSGKSAPTFTPNIATTTPPPSDAGAKTSASLAASDGNPVLSTSWSSDSKILAMLNQLDSSTSSFTSSLDLRETTLVPSSAEQKQLQKQTTKVLDADDSYITGSPQIDLDEGSNLSFLDMDYNG